MKTLSFARLPRVASLALVGLTVSLIGATLASSRAAQTQSDNSQPYTVRLVYKPGEVNRYRLMIDSTVSSELTGGKETPVLLSMVMKELTKEVKPDGSAVLVSNFEQAFAKFGDQGEIDATSFVAGVFTQTRDTEGHVLEAKVEGGSSLFGGTNGGETMFSQAGATFYPPNPVKVGETWKIALESKNPKLKSYKVNGTATLVGTEQIRDLKTLKIKTATDTTGGEKGDVKLHFEGVGNIDPTTGKLVRINGTTEGFAGPLGNSKMKIQMELLKDDEKAGPDKKAADASKASK